MKGSASSSTSTPICTLSPREVRDRAILNGLTLLASGYPSPEPKALPPGRTVDRRCSRPTIIHPHRMGRDHSQDGWSLVLTVLKTGAALGAAYVCYVVAWALWGTP